MKQHEETVLWGQMIINTVLRNCCLQDAFRILYLVFTEEIEAEKVLMFKAHILTMPGPLTQILFPSYYEYCFVFIFLGFCSNTVRKECWFRMSRRVFAKAGVMKGRLPGLWPCVKFCDRNILTSFTVNSKLFVRDYETRGPFLQQAAVSQWARKGDLKRQHHQCGASSDQPVHEAAVATPEFLGGKIVREWPEWKGCLCGFDRRCTTCFTDLILSVTLWSLYYTTPSFRGSSHS